jgi:hypothetical protein
VPQPGAEGASSVCNKVVTNRPHRECKTFLLLVATEGQILKIKVVLELYKNANNNI